MLDNLLRYAIYAVLGAASAAVGWTTDTWQFWAWLIPSVFSLEFVSHFFRDKNTG